MKNWKTIIKVILLSILFIFSCVLLYYHFFVRVNGQWIFWETRGENIDWESIEYEDFVLDKEVETLGEYGEWQIVEMNPIYVGYDSTTDGLNYLIGKYLDEKGKEHSIRILVSGEGMIDYPYPDEEYQYIFDNVYKERVAIKRRTVEEVLEDEQPKYTGEEAFVGIESYELSMFPESLVLSREELVEILKEKGPTGEEEIYTEEEALANGYEIVSDKEYEEIFSSSNDFSELTNSYYIEESLFEKYYNPTYMFDFLDYTDFESLVSELKIGEQIGVVYLKTEENFDNCKYDVNGVYKIFCSNALLNERYDTFVVSIYLVVTDLK